MPLLYVPDVEYLPSFLPPASHGLEIVKDSHCLADECPEKASAQLRGYIPGTADAAWTYVDAVRRQIAPCVALQSASSWPEVLDTCTTIYPAYTSPALSRTPSPTPSFFELPSRPLSGSRAHDSPAVAKHAMAKKRRSLQSILIPPFLHPALSASASPQTSPTSSRFRSHSAAASTTTFVLPPAIPVSPTTDESPRRNDRNSPPPADLLDDDPFADLSPTPSTFFLPDISLTGTPTSPRRHAADVSPTASPSRSRVHSPTPRSPLAMSFTEAEDEEDISPLETPWSSPPVTPPSTPMRLPSPRPSQIFRRPSASTHGQNQAPVRPAYTRPAFAPRPSLPSLSTLARLNIHVPQLKRGRVGAKLPAEPWAQEVEECAKDTTDANQELEYEGSSDSRRASLITIKGPRTIGEEPDCESESGLSDRDLLLMSAPDSDSFFRASASTSTSRSPFRTLQLNRAQSDPTPSSSSSRSSATTPPLSHACDTESSSEGSLLSTQPSFDSLSASYTPQAPVSIYGDLTSSLDYDYLGAISRLDRTPSPRSYFIAPRSPLQEDLSLNICGCEPGTSAQTLRGVHPPSAMSHQRTASNASNWTFNMPQSPLCQLTQTQSVLSPMSSDEDDADMDYFSFASSASDRESVYMSAAASRAVSFVTYDEESEQDSDSPGSSAPDITSRLTHLIPSDMSERSSYYLSADEAVDGGENGQRAGNGSFHGSSEYHGASGRAQGNGHSWVGGNGLRNGSGGGRDEDDDDRDRRPRGRTAPSARVYAGDYESEESEDEDERHRGRSGRTTRAVPPPPETPSTDDDVPLAQRLPTALKAQKSIRAQVRAEHEQRKRAKSLRRPNPADSAQDIPAVPRAPNGSISMPRSRQASSPDRPSIPSLSASAAQPIASRTRARTNTLPSKPTSPFSVGELTKKLLDVQSSLPPLPSARQYVSRQDNGVFPTDNASRVTGQVDRVPTALKGGAQEESISQRGLQPMRSFHRPRTATAADIETAPPVPGSGGAMLGRSASRRRPADELPSSSPLLANAQLGGNLERKRSARSHSRMPSADERPPYPSVSPVPPDVGAGVNLERKRSTRSQSRRPSIDRGRASHESTSRPPLPPLPSASIDPKSSFSLPPAPAKTTMWHQRIFIGSLQRFSQIEMASTYTARDVLELLQNQSALDNGSATGWMLWEVCQDFGLERPIRSFEVVSEVSNSWIAGKTVNMFMAKKTPLAAKLSRAALPSSSPIYSGWVQHEYKKGKWQKRWMELREHSLWLSKRETGKDQIMLCSMNNFDAYAVTRPAKAPKGFVFAVKSTDNISYFESTSDYIHLFSAPEKDGEQWLENILLARSYVIHQERNVITSFVNGNGNGNGPGAALSRAGTRRRPAQPLVNFGGQSIPTEPPPPTTPVFEPGSLLAKRTL